MERERESERDESNYWMNRNCWQNIFSYFLHDFSAWCYRQNIFTTLKRGWHNVYVDFLCIFRFLQYKIWCCQARNLIYYSFRKMKPLHRTAELVILSTLKLNTFLFWLHYLKQQWIIYTDIIDWWRNGHDPFNISIVLFSIIFVLWWMHIKGHLK